MASEHGQHGTEPGDVEHRLRLQSQLLAAVGQAVLAVDADGVVVHWNTPAEQLYGWSAEEVLGHPVGPIIDRVVDGSSGLEAERRDALARNEPWSGEVRRRRRDGTTFVAVVADSPYYDEGGSPAGVITVATDITDRIAAERHARALAMQQAAVARVGELVIGKSDLQAVFERACELVADAFDADVVSLLLPDDAGGDLRLVAGVGFRDGDVGHHRVPADPSSLAGLTVSRGESVRVTDLAGDDRFVPPWLLLELGVTTGMSTVLHGDDGPVGVLGAYRRAAEAFDADTVNALQSIADMIARAVERDHLRLTLSNLALTDQLTGLPNRALFQDRMQHLLVHREPPRAAVLFIDLDDFKDVNDALGHDVGDEVLREVARRLRELCREADTVARFGGDEFAVLAEGVDDATAAELAERLIHGVADRPVDLDGRELRIGMSVGVAVLEEGSEPASLLRDADMAMYRAKASGGSRVRVFDEQMRLSAVERLNLAGDLRGSIDRSELVVHYQPEIELDGPRIWAEALVRWAHPERGLLGPTEFVGLAEETGFVVDLGRWVLDEALAQMAAWVRAGGDAPSSMSVNLSTWQLVDDDIVRLTEELLAHHDLDPGRLYFELTETALLREPEESLAALEALKRLGVGLAVDDFGTGYSSLSYVRTLPVDAVKIDRTFVQGIGVDPRDDGIVDAIIALARSFDILTIAEGVETEAQFAYLADLGCDFVQGYLVAAPGTAADVEAWIRSRR